MTKKSHCLSSNHQKKSRFWWLGKYKNVPNASWMCDYQIHLALMEKLFSIWSFLNVFYYVFVFNRKRLISSSVSLSKKTKRPSKMRTVIKSQKSQRKQTHCPRRRSQEVCVFVFFGRRGVFSPARWMQQNVCDESLSVSLSDPSQDYTDSTGVNLHEFLVNTLKNNPRCVKTPPPSHERHPAVS